ncbi:Integrase catalytic domain-containing protein [Citrus sinensis]|uniref:Integrase catalytic domain-containing protein n=1 Tax=Citrus sinensis TaxID=2711 RepID=A0ACB8M872_CITSI|nr:Integrase catalytic domain-containing protein [Citrus sinensis]
MEQNENVYSMYTRFTDIVNTLGALGKTFSNSEKVKKIIRSLPKEWRPKRTAIEEAKDLNTLPLDDLIGSLISYEEDLAAEKGHEEKKKSIALKASKHESDGESEPDDEELAMLTRRFIKFFKKTRERKNFRNFKNHREKKEAITCYECKKPGHIRSECPLINKLKKKVMVATWDDSEEESSDEEGSQEVSNLALMAIGGDDDLNEGLKKKKNKWYLDSGCSRHMTGNYAWFSSFTKIENGGDVSFGDNSKGKIIGIGNVDLFGPSRYASLNGKYYAFVIVDDFSRYTWVLFLANKDDALDAFKVLYKKLQNEKGHDIICIRSDHGGEFENHAFENFCNNLGIEHQFSSPRTPQQNGVVERKNRSIQEMARTMLNENALPKYFWAEAVNTACYVLNRVLIRPHLNKTPYELWKDRKPNIGYFKVFGCKCFILNIKDNLGKFDPKSDVGIFLGYSNSSKAYRVYNKRTLVVEESMHVTFDESNPSSAEKGVANDDADGDLQEESSKEIQENASQENQEDRQEEQTNTELEQQEEFSSCMSKEFEMSMMGELKYFFGLQIKQNEEGIFINQAKYVKDLLKRFGIDDSKTKNTPMSTTTKLNKDEKGKEVDIKMYRDMIGSLLYLTASRADIMFSVCLCARFQSCPKESHLLAVKRIFRYLSGTIDIGLWYPRRTHIDLTCYSDADFAGYKVDRKSTSGTCYILGHSFVSWFSKKQNSVALSTTEAEYIAAGSCCAQALWMK